MLEPTGADSRRGRCNRTSTARKALRSNGSLAAMLGLLPCLFRIYAYVVEAKIPGKS